MIDSGYPLILDISPACKSAMIRHTERSVMPNLAAISSAVVLSFAAIQVSTEKPKCGGNNPTILLLVRGAGSSKMNLAGYREHRDTLVVCGWLPLTGILDCPKRTLFLQAQRGRYPRSICIDAAALPGDQRFSNEWSSVPGFLPRAARTVGDLMLGTTATGKLISSKCSGPPHYPLSTAAKQNEPINWETS